MSDIRQKVTEGLKAGESFEISRTFTLDETRDFGALTRDYNPVHYDENFSRGKGFSGLICHGLLVGSMLCEVGGQLAWLATEMNFRFKAPVYPGDTITCRMAITDIDAQGRATAEVQYLNQHGRLVQEATLKGLLPRPQDRQRLKEMAEEGDPSNPLAD